MISILYFFEFVHFNLTSHFQVIHFSKLNQIEPKSRFQLSWKLRLGTHVILHGVFILYSLQQRQNFPNYSQTDVKIELGDYENPNTDIHV